MNPTSPNNGKNPKRLKRSLLVYYLGLLLIVIFINVLLSPSPRQIDYSDFIDLLDQGKIDVVQLQGDEIAIKLKDSEGSRSQVYTTINVGDPELTQRLLDAKVRFGAVTESGLSSLLSMLLYMVLPFAIMALLGTLMFRSISKKMGGPGAMTFGKSNAKVYVEAQTGKTFADVAGQDEAKEALTETGGFPPRAGALAAASAHSCPKAPCWWARRAPAKRCWPKRWPVKRASPSFPSPVPNLWRCSWAWAQPRSATCLNRRRKKPLASSSSMRSTPSGKARDSSLGGNDEREQTLNQLLSEMDGFDGSKGVIILAATNRPETLDPALLRPGRFDRRIPVELPDLNGRVAILKVHAKDVHVASGVDWNVIARATAGASGAELANIINEGALRAVRCGRDTVEQQDFEEAVETVIAGYQRKDAAINEHEKQVVAYHEIGHALVAAKQKDSAPVHKITIVPRTSGALGYTMQVDEQERKLMTKEEALAKVATLTGGRAAEELIFGTGYFRRFQRHRTGHQDRPHDDHPVWHEQYL